MVLLPSPPDHIPSHSSYCQCGKKAHLYYKCFPNHPGIVLRSVGESFPRLASLPEGSQHFFAQFHELSARNPAFLTAFDCLLTVLTLLQTAAVLLCGARKPPLECLRTAHISTRRSTWLLGWLRSPVAGVTLPPYENSTASAEVLSSLPERFAPAEWLSCVVDSPTCCCAETQADLSYRQRSVFLFCGIFSADDRFVLYLLCEEKRC